MKEVALIGTGGAVYADVLSKLLEDGLSVNAFVPNPERMMIENTALTISLLDLDHSELMTEVLGGYDQAVIAIEIDQTNAQNNDVVNHYYNKWLKEVINAGVKRLVVVAPHATTAFVLSHLNATTPELDWVLIPTDGDFARHTVKQLVEPSLHRTVREI